MTPGYGEGGRNHSAAQVLADVVAVAAAAVVGGKGKYIIVFLVE